MEIFKRAKGITGKEVYNFFEKYKLFEFVIDNYELLHIHGEQYILQDLDTYIIEFSV